MRLIFLLSLFIFVFNQLHAQTKNIYWLHGLEGRQEMMFPILNKYQSERNCNGITFQYSTQNGINGSATEMNEKMTLKNSQVIVVVQSMGGLNARYLYQQSEKGNLNAGTPFGGLITLGGPHAGAPIANCLENGILKQLEEDIVEKGTLGPRNDGIISLTFINSIVEFVGDIFGFAVPSLEDLVQRFVHEALEKNVAKCFGSEIARQDLKPESEKISQMANYEMNIPMIAIWGNENSPAFLRLASARLYNEKHNFNIPWGQVDDDKFVKIVNIVKDYCNVRKTYFEVASAVNPLSWIGAKTYSSFMKTNYTKSYNFWNGELQYSLDRLIGAFKTEQQVYYSYEQSCAQDPFNNQNTNDTWYIECDNWGYTPYTVTATVPQPSDGIVPKSSAIALPGVNQSCIIEAVGVNHEELKNHYEIANIFNKIFEGQIYDNCNPTFFQVSKK